MPPLITLFDSSCSEDEVDKNESDWPPSDGSVEFDNDVVPSIEPGLEPKHLRTLSKCSDLKDDRDYNDVEYLSTESRPKSERETTATQFSDVSETDSGTNCSNQEEVYTRTRTSESRISEDREFFINHLAKSLEKEDLKQLYPASLSLGWTPPMPVSSEHEVLKEFCSHILNEEGKDDFTELELHSFCVYRAINHPKKFEGQYENLSNTPFNPGCFSFDGILQDNSTERYVIDVPIKTISIGGLDDPCIHTSKDTIWLLSVLNDRDIEPCWYRAHLPVPEYNQHWEEFLWLADLAKHVIDWMSYAVRNGMEVTLSDFAATFWTTINTWHQKDADFCNWHRQCTTTDFRIHLVRHSIFIHDQVYAMGKHPELRQLRVQPLWDEMCVGEISYDQTSQASKEKTVVTPYIASAFLKVCPAWKKHDLLEIVEMDADVENTRNHRHKSLHFPRKVDFPQSEHFEVHPKQGYISKAALMLESAAVQSRILLFTPDRLLGRAVVIREKDSVRKTDSFEYAIVKEVTGERLRVVWLLLPSQTICGSNSDGSFYPIGNELFYSDKCNCGTIHSDRVVAHFGITEFSDHAEQGAQLFVQLLYQEDEAAIKTATKSQLLCKCWQTETRSAYRGKQAHPRSIDKTRSTFTSITAGVKNKHQIPKLRNLSLFSGCGMLDFGLEECGMIETVFAIDQNEAAIRSHQANSKSKDCRHITGSVNEWLRKFLTGEESLFQADSISAGCPCQGFTNLNVHKSGIKSLRNCSLLASTMSWIELFLPAYVILENVPGMDYASKARGIKNACAQAISCLVALGYQVKKVFRKIPEATEFGAATSRKRLFLFAAAPGYELPRTPLATHGEGVRGLRHIVTVRDTIRDLEPITNDTQINIKRPDHIPLVRFKYDWNKDVSFPSLIRRIPKTPSGLGIYHVYQHNLLSASELEWWNGLSGEKKSDRSKFLSRVNPDKPFATIVTTVCPEDARHGGRCLHPFEDRVFSLLEYRRAQGIKDSFIIIGRIGDQLHQIGNGVVWQMASVLGQSIGQAWKDSFSRGASETLPCDSKVESPTHSAHKEDLSVEASTSAETMEVGTSERPIDLDISDSSDEDEDPIPINSRRSRSTTTKSTNAHPPERNTRDPEKRTIQYDDIDDDIVFLGTQSVSKKVRMG